MKFKAYVPYSKLDLCIMAENDMEINYFYPTLKELREEHPDADYSYLLIDGFELELDEGTMRFDDIQEN